MNPRIRGDDSAGFDYWLGDRRQMYVREDSRCPAAWANPKLVPNKKPGLAAGLLYSNER
jgi:hypothetical protein